MSMFAGTVGFYRRYRPGIPESVAAVLDQATPNRHPRRLLDIGTGTGLVVEALLGRFDDIIATDNDPQMVAAAEAAQRPALPGGTRLLVVEANAEAFTPPAGWRADLVTICRAFHWLDQPTVLQRLDEQVAPDGAVAILGDNSFWAAGNPWKAAVRRVVQDFLGEQRRAGGGAFQHHDRPYSEIMAESPFHHVEENRIPVQRTWTTESILGYLYSTTFAAPRCSVTGSTSSNKRSRPPWPLSAAPTRSMRTTSSSSASDAGASHEPRPRNPLGLRREQQDVIVPDGTGGGTISRTVFPTARDPLRALAPAELLTPSALVAGDIGQRS